jgi:hypothetical protein
MDQRKIRKAVLSRVREEDENASMGVESARRLWIRNSGKTRLEEYPEKHPSPPY